MLIPDLYQDETLYYQRTLTALRKPSAHELHFLQQWMKRPTMGGVYLLGQDSDIWSNPKMSDLVTLRSTFSEDPTTLWITEHAVKWWHQIIGRHFRVNALATLEHCEC